MANLSKVTDLTRKLLEIGVAIVVGVFLIFILIQLFTVIKNVVSPTPPTPPTVTFGKLQAITFPQSQNPTTYSYSINTLSGNLPTLPDRITVYKLQQPVPDLLALDKAKQIASGANFLGNPTALSETAYQWTNSDPFPMTFTMDISSFDFTLTSSYKSDPTVTGAANLPDETTARTAASAFFDSVLPLPQSVDPSKTKTTLLSIQPTGLMPASSLSQAQIIRVDYFPKPIDTYPVYTADPAKSLIYALVASGTTNFPQIVETQYIHKNIANQKATYPIKSAKEAYKELQAGKAYIAASPTGNTNVAITDVSLGYYLEPQNQQYLWPIIIFQGDNGFTAYVSAVTDEWVQM